MYESEFRVNHNLLVLPEECGGEVSDKNNFGSISKISSHWQAIAQCSNYLKQKGLYEKVDDNHTKDTATAARLIREQKLPTAGAIASRRAAELYNLRILGSAIQDNKHNYTRFLLIKRVHDRAVKKIPSQCLLHGSSGGSGEDPEMPHGSSPPSFLESMFLRGGLRKPTFPDLKTSLVLSTAHKPGALFRVLETFNRLSVNLTKIESRPTKPMARGGSPNVSEPESPVPSEGGELETSGGEESDTEPTLVLGGVHKIFSLKNFNYRYRRKEGMEQDLVYQREGWRIIACRREGMEQELVGAGAKTSPDQESSPRGEDEEISHGSKSPSADRFYTPSDLLTLLQHDPAEPLFRPRRDSPDDPAEDTSNFHRPPPTDLYTPAHAFDKFQYLFYIDFLATTTPASALASPNTASSASVQSALSVEEPGISGTPNDPDVLDPVLLTRTVLRELGQHLKMVESLGTFPVAGSLGRTALFRDYVLRAVQQRTREEQRGAAALGKQQVVVEDRGVEEESTSDRAVGSAAGGE